MKKFILLGIFFFGVLPELAFASSSLSGFMTPLEKIMDTLSGPLAKVIVVGAFLVAAYQLAVNGEDLSGSTKKILYVVLAASVMAGASTFADLFGFSGALI